MKVPVILAPLWYLRAASAGKRTARPPVEVRGKSAAKSAEQRSTVESTNVIGNATKESVPHALEILRG